MPANKTKHSKPNMFEMYIKLFLPFLKVFPPCVYGRLSLYLCINQRCFLAWMLFWPEVHLAKETTEIFLFNIVSDNVRVEFTSWYHDACDPLAPLMWIPLPRYHPLTQAASKTLFPFWSKGVTWGCNIFSPEEPLPKGRNGLSVLLSHIYICSWK